MQPETLWQTLGLIGGLKAVVSPIFGIIVVINAILMKRDMREKIFNEERNKNGLYNSYLSGVLFKSS